MSESQPLRLSRRVRLWVFLRSLLLQASWNPKGMQNLGFAYAVLPALKGLYPEPAALKAAMQRHFAVFNTHPYAAAALLGGVLYHEERISRGEEGPERVMAFREALMGPLAALGDGFFWMALKPASGALGALLVPSTGLWAPVAFLVFYNVVHFGMRIRFYRIGLELGDRLVEEVARAKLPRRGAHLRSLGAGFAGAAAATLALTLGRIEPGLPGMAFGLGFLVWGALGYALLGRHVSRYALLYGSAAAGVAVGVWG